MSGPWLLAYPSGHHNLLCPHALGSEMKRCYLADHLSLSLVHAVAICCWLYLLNLLLRLICIGLIFTLLAMSILRVCLTLCGLRRAPLIACPNMVSSSLLRPQIMPLVPHLKAVSAALRFLPSRRSVAAAFALLGSSFATAVRVTFGHWVPSFRQLVYSNVRCPALLLGLDSNT